MAMVPLLSFQLHKLLMCLLPAMTKCIVSDCMTLACTNHVFFNKMMLSRDNRNISSPLVAPRWLSARACNCSANQVFSQCAIPIQQSSCCVFLQMWYMAF